MDNDIPLCSALVYGKSDASFYISYPHQNRDYPGYDYIGDYGMMAIIVSLPYSLS